MYTKNCVAKDSMCDKPKRRGKKALNKRFLLPSPDFSFFGACTVVTMEALVFGYQYSINDKWVQGNLVKIGTNATFSS